MCAILLISACQKREVLQETSEPHNVITLIFDKTSTPRNPSFEDGKQITFDPAPLIYYDGRSVVPISRAYERGDTVVIRTASAFIVLEHGHHWIESYKYVIQKGETIFFSYDNDTPVARILNSQTHAIETNIELEFEKRHPRTTRFLPISTYYIPELSFDFRKQSEWNKRPKIIRESYAESKKRFTLELRFLDSLHLHKQIPDEVYSFYRDKVKYDDLLLELNDNRITFADSKHILMHDVGNLSPTSSIHYDKFAKRVAELFIVTQVRRLNFGNTIIFDYREAYDSISASSLFYDELKSQLLREQIVQIAEYFSLRDFEKYFNRFESEVNDSLALGQLRRKYLLDFSSAKMKSDSLYLITAGKEPITFDEVTESNNGRLIYIDFWASWCGPCREGMSKSKILRERYNNDVAFVYLSIDKDFDKWMKASVEEGLNELSNNYLIVNPNTSEYLKKLEVTLIPRYILIGKNGELLQTNAPGPDSPEIVKLFEEHTD